MKKFSFKIIMKAGNIKEYIETYREMKKRKKSNIIKDLNRDKQM